ncbi:ATP-binding protein [Streptomyces sp. NPDC001744]|uniref:ATP-binding protein n=1 Tax=Streptomyces sp. NPDC001744 TaxID=3364606 RepID=UPI0036C591DA
MAIPFGELASGTRRQAAPMQFIAVWETTDAPIADFRHATRALLALAGHLPGHRASQDAQLVVTELVTNAYRHAPGPGVLLLELTPGEFLLDITVRDGSPHPPLLRPPDATRPGGHGLRLVARLCERLHHNALGTGKEVVARLHLRRPAG